MGPVGKNDSDGTDEAKMASNVICKCEKVTGKYILYDRLIVVQSHTLFVLLP